MSRWNAESDMDYAESIGDPVERQQHSEDSPLFRCVQCNQKMRPVHALAHAEQTGHTLRYRGRLVTSKKGAA